jgi:hypothetical protein
MSNINQYPLEAFQINDEDFYDLDYWNGVSYETRKISGATLKLILAGGAEVLNDLNDVNTDLPLLPDNADDGRILYFDVDSGNWISDDIANIANVVKDCKTSIATGSIAKGTPVYYAGFDNDLIVVEACDASDPLKMPCIGIVAEDLDDTNAKKVISFGKLQGVDTSAYADGDELYIAAGGGFSTIRPIGNSEIQRIAVVLKAGNPGGLMKIFNTSRTAGLPNLTDGHVWVGDSDSYPIEIPFTNFLENIYNTDGSLDSQRLVDMNQNGLFFTTNDGGSQNLIMGIFDQGAAHRVEIGDTFYINDINLEVKGLSLFYNSPIINNSFSAIFLKFSDNAAGFDLNFEMEALTLSNKTQTFQDQSGTIALLSDIPSGDNIYNASGSLTSARFLSLNAFQLFISDLAGTTKFDGGNKIEISANSGQEAILKFLAGNGEKRGISFTDQGDDRWEWVAEGLEAGANSGTNFVIYRYDDAGVLINKAIEIIRSSGEFIINEAYSLPIADGNAGDAMITDGAGNVTFQPSSGAETHIDSFYAFDMSQAAGYTWDAQNVAASALVTINESIRAQSMAGVGGSDGCFMNSSMPSYYSFGGSLKVTVNLTYIGVGGDFKLFLGIQEPRVGGLIGDESSTIWNSQVLSTVTSESAISMVFIVSGFAELSALSPFSIKLYRNPGDAADSYGNDIYINSLLVEIN